MAAGDLRLADGRDQPDLLKFCLQRFNVTIPSEGTGDRLALITWVIFGSAAVGQAVGNFSWMIVLYSVLSLTLIRMLPVFLSLTISGIDTEGKLFIGWFGPRGLASIGVKSTQSIRLVTESIGRNNLSGWLGRAMKPNCR